MPHLVTNSRVKKQLPNFMRQFDPNFSLDHFVGKLISIINILVYSDDLSNCALYGEETTEAVKQDTRDTENIIYMRFCGYLEGNQCWVDNGYAYVNLTIDMDDIYCQKGKIRSKRINSSSCFAKTYTQQPITVFPFTPSPVQAVAAVLTLQK